MKEAVFQGILVTPEHFVNAAPNWRETGVHAVCPLCRNRVHPYGTHSPNVTPRFDHIDGITWCPNSNTADPRYRDLKPTEVDIEQAALLREVFMKTEVFDRSFDFCRYLVGNGFNDNVYSKLINQADRVNIWCYKNIPLWVVPYILLTLDNFTNIKQDKSYSVSFRFIKPAGKTDSIWIKPNECKLIKIFTDSEQPCKFPFGNPFPLTELTMWTIGEGRYESNFKN